MTKTMTFEFTVTLEPDSPEDTIEDYFYGLVLDGAGASSHCELDEFNLVNVSEHS